MTHHAQILIVDDQPRARQGLRGPLSVWPFAVEIRKAVDGEEPVQLVEERLPDMELRMAACELDGLWTTQPIKARWP